jgi:hypothetical protein
MKTKEMEIKEEGEENEKTRIQNLRVKNILVINECKIPSLSAS